MTPSHHISRLLSLIVCSWNLLVCLSQSSNGISALEKARRLQLVPQVAATTGGELEHLEFWEEHEELLQNAWREWSQVTTLPALEEAVLINTTLYQQVHQLWKEPTIEKENLLKELWKEVIPGVWVWPQFFTVVGLHQIRNHLQATAESGIPTRRPNGMNRQGIVWDDQTQGGVCYPQILEFRQWLVDTYFRPLARSLFPHYSGIKQADDVEAYAFTIHYNTAGHGESNNTDTTIHDMRLPEHSDASIFTMNINLNLPNEDYQGSILEFVVEDEHGNATKASVRMEPGMAVLHRGMQRHQALTIQSGERHQMVLWLFGPHGYVQVVPYKSYEQRSVEERWSLPTQLLSSSTRGGDKRKQDDDDDVDFSLKEL